MKRYLFPGLCLMLGVLILLMPICLLKTCPPMPNGKMMKCHWMGMAEVGVGALIALSSLWILFQKQAVTRRRLYPMISLMSLLVLLIPAKLIGTCGKAEMCCNTGTAPGLYAAGVILLAVTFAALFLDRDRVEA